MNRYTVIAPWMQSDCPISEEELRKQVRDAVTGAPLKPPSGKIYLPALKREVSLKIEELPTDAAQPEIKIEWRPLDPALQAARAGGATTGQQTAADTGATDGLKPGRVSLSAEEEKIFQERWHLPVAAWSEYWDRIYVDGDAKQRLLNYIHLLRSLENAHLSSVGLSLHRTVMLYGPPGTGKTTLARGLAQQLALLSLPPYHTIVLELDAHELSSKWQGDAPKNVKNAFTRVREQAQGGSPTVLIMDEVESLFTQRGLSINEANPVDVFNAVNAALQQLDITARDSKVLSVVTSNLPRAVDQALFDRVDLAIFLDLPGPAAREAILKDTLAEIQRAWQGAPILEQWEVPDHRRELVKATEGLSGRQIRKLVVQALLTRKDLAEHPDLLNAGDLMAAARLRREQQERDLQHGGIYDAYAKKG